MYVTVSTMSCHYRKTAAWNECNAVYNNSSHKSRHNIVLFQTSGQFIWTLIVEFLMFKHNQNFISACCVVYVNSWTFGCKNTPLKVLRGTSPIITGCI